MVSKKNLTLTALSDRLIWLTLSLDCAFSLSFEIINSCILKRKEN